jgi:hypothetical protein
MAGALRSRPTDHINNLHEGINHMETFCATYLSLGGDLAHWAKWFIVAALVVAVISALTEVIKAYRAPPTGRLAPAPAATAIKDVAEALKSLITALSTAPIWLALFGAGVLLFWVPGNAVEICRPTTSQGVTNAGGGASTNPTSGSSQTGH